MAERVVLVFPATSYRVGAYLEAAEALGIELVLATDLVGAAARHHKETHRVDFADPVQAAASLASRLSSVVDGVLGVDERSSTVAAALAATSACRGRHHGLHGVLATRDKRLMRKELAAAGVNVPRFFVLARDVSEDRILAPSFPCVVKPPMLSGSQGVMRADDVPSLHAAVARVRSILERHSSALSTVDGFFDLLVEEYVEGEEVAVEALMHQGRFQLLAIFDKPDALTGPTFEESLYVTPSTKAEAATDLLAATTLRAAEALGLSDGPIHAELRMCRQSGMPVVIEIAARSIGGLCSRALGHVLGFGFGSLEERLLSNAIGRVPLPLPEARTAGGVMMIPVPKSGVLSRVRGLEEARAVPGVDGVEITVLPGEAIRQLPEGDRYFGFVFAHGADAGAVEASLRAAHAELSFELKPLLPLAW